MGKRESRGSHLDVVNVRVDYILDQSAKDFVVVVVVFFRELFLRFVIETYTVHQRFRGKCSAAE